MEHNFWHERWQSNQLGFHQDATNQRLMTYWPQLALAAGSTVLVPLCGKSLDMAWLAAQGHKVLGIELSQIAVDAFFSENKLTVTKETVGEFEVSNCFLCHRQLVLTEKSIDGDLTEFNAENFVALRR